MGERKLLSEDLVVRREWADCGWCEKPRHECICEVARMTTSYETPTPADLLTDPRVRALVAALRRVQGDYSIEEEEWRCVDEALAPFEGVPRG